jgi:hypothetical protein
MRTHAAAILLLGAFGSAHATVINDTYIGADNNGYGDVIGATSQFDIHSAEVNLSGSLLTLSINTNFAGRGDDGLFSAYTRDAGGIGYGDLFLASSWTPNTSGPNFINDNAATGTLWGYGFSLDDRWSSTGGTGTLYSLNGPTNADNAILSDTFMTGGSRTGAVWRNGQEVAVDTQSAQSTGITGNWVVDALNRRLTFSIDLAGTDLLTGDELAFHWGMTCANDVIEGAVHNVPEPASLALLGAGLLGVAAARKARRRKS